MKRSLDDASFSEGGFYEYGQRVGLETKKQLADYFKPFKLRRRVTQLVNDSRTDLVS